MRRYLRPVLPPRQIRHGHRALIAALATLAVAGVPTTSVAAGPPARPAGGVKAAAAADVRLEAESAALSGGARVETEHPGFTGTGFVGGYIDGNKGAAATTFAVATAKAGTTPLTLRYANGTGTPKTLSLYVNGTKAQQFSLPATANWSTWGIQALTAALPAGNSSVAIKFDAADSGNVNLDHLVVGDSDPGPGDPGDPVAGQYEAETSFRSGGPSVSDTISGYSGSGYVTGFSATGARVIFAANAPAAEARQTTLRYSNASGATRALSVYANGIKAGQVVLPAGTGWQTAATTLSLRAGLNTITYQRDSGDSGEVSIDRINLGGGLLLAARGATLPYTAYEAEASTTNGQRLNADRTYKTLASESSGRSAVTLNSTGQYVQITLTRPANALTVRYSMPDNATGTGTNATLSLYANGNHVRDLALTSRYAWVYGAYPYDNNPGGGNAHRFYDETRALIGDWPAGTTLRLQKDSGDTSVYTIDVIDAEQAPAAATMPAGHISATDFGATPNDSSDDTDTLRTAINNVKSTGRSLWIPAGTFRITSRIDVQGVTIRGSGPWHTTLLGANGRGGFFATGSNVQISDLALTNDVSQRLDSSSDAAFEGNFGTGSSLSNLFIYHSKVGLWADHGTSGLHASALRIRDTYADGVNLHGNVTGTRIEQSSVRNTGDDALAMWSDGSAVTGSAFTNNTLQLPMLANTAAIYGGNGNSITGNAMSDTVTGGAGIQVGNRFRPVPLSGTVSIARNTLTRTGGQIPEWGPALIGGLWIFADPDTGGEINANIQVCQNTINDSTYSGVLMSYGLPINGAVFNRNTIDATGRFGVEISNITGGAVFNYTRVTNARDGGLHNPDPSRFTITGTGNTGF